MHSWQLNMRQHDELTFELADGGQLAGMLGQFAGICMLFVIFFGLLFLGLACIMGGRFNTLLNSGGLRKSFQRFGKLFIADHPLIERIWLVNHNPNCRIEHNHQGQQR